MKIRLLSVGTEVIFLSGIGYKNKKGEVRYDVKSGAKGIIKKARVKDGKPIYNIELSIGKTLRNTKLLEDVEGDWIETVSQDIIKPVNSFPRRIKKDRPWRKFPTSLLEDFAVSNEIVWKKNDNPRVNRMFLVKALDDSGVKPPRTEKELKQQIVKQIS